MAKVDKTYLLKTVDQILDYERLDAIANDELRAKLLTDIEFSGFDNSVDELSAFIKETAKFDGRAQTLSRFDVLWSLVDESKLNHTDWWDEIGKTLEGSSDEYLWILADPLFHQGQYCLTTVLRSRALFVDLMKSTADASSSNLLAGLHIYAESLIKNTPAETAFKKYFSVTWHDFSKSPIARKAEIMTAAVDRGMPDISQCQQLVPLLTGTEYQLFTELCFLKNTEVSFSLFEANPYPFPQAQLNKGAAGVLISSDTYEYEEYWQATQQLLHFSFPSLDQNETYEVRMEKLRAFLGEPSFSENKEFIDSQASDSFSTQLQKFTLVGDTECFLLDSHKPGPVTLVFSPHFHEPNPRRAFHWMKDLPLQSGAVIFMPEANRAMYESGMDTYAMNSIFGKTLQSSRMDYLILRRVEYLMGLADGLIGVHDSAKGPFFISDRGVTPRPSPRVEMAPQPPLPLEGAHWQLAQKARETMKGISGMETYYAPNTRYSGMPLDADPSFLFFATRPGGATGYMNQRLQKPAMTFEGNKGGDHGSLHAAAQYALLKAYGHQIDPAFETQILTDPIPEPNLYVGLPFRQ